MAKVNQTAVKEKLEEWAEVQAKISRADIAKNKKMSPLIEAHNQEIKPIVEAYDKKVQPLRERSAEIEKAIKALIESDRDADGNPKPVMISSESATATVEKKEGSRVVNVQKYFNSVKVKTAEFWKSLKVTIKDAEPIVGKNKIDDLSDKTPTFVSSIRLK